MNKKYLEIKKGSRTITFYSYAPKNEIDIEIETDWSDSVTVQINKEEIQSIINFLQGQLTDNEQQLH